MIELLVVVIILGILASVAIPIYTSKIEELRGKACQQNMRMVLNTWRIYNIQGKGPIYVHPSGQIFHSTGNICNMFGISINEKYFGYVDSVTCEPGFWLSNSGINWVPPYLHIFAHRLRPSKYAGESIDCRYYFVNGTYDWHPRYPGTTWPLPLEE